VPSFDIFLHVVALIVFSMLLLQGEIQDTIWNEDNSKFRKRLTRDALAHNREMTKEEFPFLQVILSHAPRSRANLATFRLDFPCGDLSLPFPSLPCLFFSCEPRKQAKQGELDGVSPRESNLLVLPLFPTAGEEKVRRPPFSREV